MRDHQQIEQPVGELLARRVGRICTERRVSPARLGTDRDACRKVPAAAQRGKPLVVDPARRERGGERPTSVMRDSARARKATNIDDHLDVVGVEYGQKTLKRPRGVAYGPEHRRSNPPG